MPRPLIAAGAPGRSLAAEDARSARRHDDDLAVGDELEVRGYGLSRLSLRAMGIASQEALADIEQLRQELGNNRQGLTGKSHFTQCWLLFSELSNFGYPVVLYKMKQCILGLSRTARIFSFFPVWTNAVPCGQNIVKKKEDDERLSTCALLALVRHI